MEETEIHKLRRFRDFLAEQDVECPGCGANLRGVTWPNCPQCHHNLELAVRLVEPRQAAFISGLVALVGGLTFYAVVLLYAAWMFIQRSGYTPPPAERLVLATVPASLLIIVALWFRLRPRLRTLARGLQITLAVACWAVSLSSVWVFFRID